MEELRRRGRPTLDYDVKRHKAFRVRLTEDEYEMMVYLADFYDISMSDVLRLGVKSLYEKR